MKNVYSVISGIGLLILVFLFLNNARSSVSVIGKIGTSAIEHIRVLQGLNAWNYGKS